MHKIFVAHLLNDYSGSPKVLSQLLKGWVGANHKVHLYTSASTQGFLSGIEGVEVHHNYYRFHRFIPLRLMVLMSSQLITLMVLLTQVRKEDVVYVNTILPFGAAIAGWIKGARVIYHIHETSVNPKIFKQFLLFWVKVCASEVIYVSDFLAKEEPIALPSHILWNAIEDDFRERASSFQRQTGPAGNVLMIASLKRYKGVDEYVEIARASPQLSFELVVNASGQEIDEYFAGRALPANLTVYPAQRDVHPFYQRADVVMNLSRPEEWKETFGLTALEAMIYGIPVIVPPVGGIAEIVHDGITGFHLNGKDTFAITATLQILFGDSAYYDYLSHEACTHAATFSERHFLRKSLEIITPTGHLDSGTAFQKMEHI
ncbi:glycosyltransferase family 4 protein [Neolewinella aurantiaca]|uniref:Glycosyltransferase family 4 protein n=1 Tax=Neolewinella aurantiaca TaxID=2602767 RepID=A0A5C7F9B0_9BACT|nr:glycosyltransferase family 4 protein [Neolewinella aurantiaca]TXF85968.1 glycosyltransferase family 4 protein [Neolewinella aurantiaca]